MYFNFGFCWLPVVARRPRVCGWSWRWPAVVTKVTLLNRLLPPPYRQTDVYVSVYNCFCWLPVVARRPRLRAFTLSRLLPRPYPPAAGRILGTQVPRMQRWAASEVTSRRPRAASMMGAAISGAGPGGGPGVPGQQMLILRPHRNRPQQPAFSSTPT